MESMEPRWFSRALAWRPEVGTVVVRGCRVSGLAWGERSAPTLVLVHGGAAHARWWSFIGPLLADRFRVVAPDLSGHGDSGWREEYGLHLWVEEVLALAEELGGVGPPVLVGHSMGGLVTALAAGTPGVELRGAVLLDSPLRRIDPESEEGRQGRMFRNPKTYPDLAAAQRHFHLVPPQPAPAPHIRHHVALHSLRRAPGGWTWKFDPRVTTERRGPAEDLDLTPGVAAASCPVAFVVGEHSDLVGSDVRARVSGDLADARPGGWPVAYVEVAAAHHHLLLDEPLQVVAVTRTLLATWGLAPLADVAEAQPVGV
jgi:pimeloyl-ACP methyl ester carboxylesterase